MFVNVLRFICWGAGVRRNFFKTIMWVLKSKGFHILDVPSVRKQCRHCFSLFAENTERAALEDVKKQKSVKQC